MRATSPDRSRSFSGAQPDTRSLSFFACLSFFGHLGLFAAIVFSPAFMPERRFSPSVIQVSMVSLPPGPAASRPAPPEPRSEPEPRPEPPAAPPTPPAPEQEIVVPATPEIVPPEPAVPEAPAEEAVSVAPQPKVYKEKTSLKKETYKPKEVAKAPEPPTEKKEKPTNARPAQVTRAIEKLREQAMTPPPGSSSAPNSQAAGGESGGGWSGGQAGGELIDIYKAEIAVRIQQNWAFSEQVAGGLKDLSAVIVLKILPSGEIGDTWFEKRSGNSFLDDSAFRAVQKSNPLPPLPKGYFRSFYLVGLIFTPEGIQ